jgi:Tol biopolymer transport system component
MELVKAAANAKYVPPPGSAPWRGAGRLLFLRDTTLYAQRFDTARLVVEGEAVPVLEGIGYVTNISFVNFSISLNCLLVYGHEDIHPARLTWTGRDGKQSVATTEMGDYRLPRLSPDATKVAVTMAEPQTGYLDVWQINLLHTTTTRFTFDPASNGSPVWSPDGKQIAFASIREGTARLYMKPASGTVNEEQISPPSSQTQSQILYDWSKDGRYLLYGESRGATGFDLWVLPMTGASGVRKPIPFLQTKFNETQGQFSPDGRWIAYTSDETGRNEVYVRSFPTGSGKFQISNNGGTQPRWRGDGKEIYYLASDSKLMAATVKSTAETFEKETLKVLFEAHWLASSGLFIFIRCHTRRPAVPGPRRDRV